MSLYKSTPEEERQTIEFMKRLQKYAGDEAAEDAAADDYKTLAEIYKTLADRYYRGEYKVGCACVPAHEYQAYEAKCPRYVEQLEAASQIQIENQKALIESLSRQLDAKQKEIDSMTRELDDQNRRLEKIRELTI